VGHRRPKISGHPAAEALARRDGDHDTFTVRFLQLRSRHERKPSLQERFDTARFPQHL